MNLTESASETGMRWVRDYLYLVSWKPYLASGAILALALAAILEGAALASLMPAIQSGITVAEVAMPKWLMWATSGRENVLGVSLLIFVVLGVLASLARFLSEGLLLKLRARIECMAREQMGHAILNMDWPTYLGLKLGDIAKSQIVEGQYLAVGAQAFIHAVASAVAVVCYLVIACYISPEMTAYTVLFGVVGAVIYKFALSFARSHADAWSGIVSTIGERLTEIFSSLKYVRSAGMVRDVEARSCELYKEAEHAFFFSQIFAAANRAFFETTGIFFIAAFLAYQIHASTQGMASALVFLAVFYRLAPRLQQTQDSLFQARNYLSWVRDWSARMAGATEAAAMVSGKVPPVFSHAISVQNVSYRYTGAAELSLQDVSLTIRRGETVAIVGGSGAGKTTLTDLLTGLLQPTTGQVLLDNVPMQTLDLDLWRRRLGVVMQETPMIHGSVMENITWGADKLDISRAKECARIAHALEFIDRMPKGFDTVIGERGGKLSGGQRQRIAIARALYRQPDLLILDEATSALDAESELAVQQAIDAMSGDYSILMVAHRLKTVRNANRIVVMEHGRVVEQGDWDALMQSRGALYRMAQLQSLAG